MPTTTRRRLRLALAALALFVGAATMPASALAQTAPEFPSVDWQFGDPGPYEYTITKIGDHTYVHPATLGAGGLDHPVILWGNGTGAPPEAYGGLLTTWASHGFIVAAANTTNAGTGREMLAGLDQLTAMNADRTSIFHGVVDLERVGASGHSQGGGGAIEAAADPRVDTAFPVQPWRGDDAAATGSILYLSGESDTIIPPSYVLGKYLSVTDRPAVYAEAAGASHFVPVGEGGAYRYATTAWARMELMDDQQAKVVFFGDNCLLCLWDAYSDVEVNDLAQRAPK